MSQSQPAVASGVIPSMTTRYEDLLIIPRKYDDFSHVTNPEEFGRIQPGDKICLALTVMTTPYQDREAKEKGIARFKFTSFAGPYKIECTEYGYLKYSPWRETRVGNTVLVKGKIDVWNRQLKLSDMVMVPTKWAGKIIPVYPAKKGSNGWSSEAFRTRAINALDDKESVQMAVFAIRERFDGMEEDQILDKCGINKKSIQSLSALLELIHDPYTVAESEMAIEAAKKIAVGSIKFAAEKASRRHMLMDSVIRIRDEEVDKAIARLPFVLTNGPTGQANAVREIIADLRAPYPMNRLLSGDVGTGKTETYLIPSIAARQSGASVVILMPNELLVDQAAKRIRQYFPCIPVETVTSGKVPEKNVLDANPILVGTTSLLKYVEKKKHHISLLITDEQQKFSRAQREFLMKAHTNVLEATATCLPRTAALITHGGMDVTILNEFPVEKQIITRIIPEAEKREMFSEIKTIINNKGQVAIIYPLVDGEKDEAGKKSVTKAVENWERLFPGRVGMLHGKMKSEEKQYIMERMKRNEFDVLIASTVIEIGVDIPSLKAIVIVHAERYGVSTLHQMRGRPARHGGEGRCFLYLPEEVSEDSMERLRLLEQTSDGFDLADLDMGMRGFGDLNMESNDQHGKSRTLFENLKLTPKDFSEPTAKMPAKQGYLI